MKYCTLYIHGETGDGRWKTSCKNCSFVKYCTLQCYDLLLDMLIPIVQRIKGFDAG